MRSALLLSLLMLSVACTSARKGDERPVAENPPPAQASPPPTPAGAPPKPGMDLPDKFTNLKVLPPDISKDTLLSTMRQMNDALGVRCNFCHQMEPTKNWAADTKHKEIARSMMLMTERINQELFTWPNAPRATCFMCHHGNKEPVMMPPPRAEGTQPGAPPPAHH